MRTVVCAECAAVFETEHPRKRFCSHNCTVTWHSRNVNAKQKDARDSESICPSCGRLFKVIRRGHIYCSPRCKESARLDRRSVREPYVRHCKVCGVTFETHTAVRVKCQACSDKRRHGAKRISSRLRRTIWEKQKNVCWLCGQPLTFEAAQAHHLDGLGQSEFPDNSEDNLVVLHPFCHAMFHRPHLVFRDGKWGVDGKVFEYLGVRNLEVMHKEV